MQITPFSEGCGVLIEDAQLAQLSDAQITQLQSALAEHGVLFLRDQHFPPAEHLRFARRFGALRYRTNKRPVESRFPH